MASPTVNENRRRDSLSLTIIGAFFALFSLLVLAGTFWEHRVRGIVVNIASGLTLLAVGAGMIAYGYWLRRTSSPAPGDGDETHDE
ncbi:MAG: hypothetical protein BMS9Abin04_510 [Planctomycetia bacterium]|nr:MAG: hypothetical protein BMS9Abin04_510 [Planctomycetia bacterium]